MFPGVTSRCLCRDDEVVYKDPPEDELYVERVPSACGDIVRYEGSPLADLVAVDSVEARKAAPVGGWERLSMS